MPRDSARTLRPRQTIDYSRTAESNGGTNTPTWIKGTGKESLRHRAARQSLSKRGKSLPDVKDSARKEASNSGGQNQPPSSSLDGRIRKGTSRSSASSQPVSSTPPAAHPVRASTKPNRAKAVGPTQQSKKKSKSSKRHTEGPQQAAVKRRKTAGHDAVDAREAQAAKGKGLHAKPSAGEIACMHAYVFLAPGRLAACYSSEKAWHAMLHHLGLAVMHLLRKIFIVS